jgi:serine protein kinase
MYDEINSFVSYVKDAAENGSSKEMAFVLVGEPGNGKTFLVDYVCNKYRDFLSQKTNRKYSFRFTGLDKIGGYGKIDHRIPDLRGPHDPGDEHHRRIPDKNREFLSRKSDFRTTKSKPSGGIIARWAPAVHTYGTASGIM